MNTSFALQTFMQYFLVHRLNFLKETEKIVSRIASSDDKGKSIGQRYTFFLHMPICMCMLMSSLRVLFESSLMLMQPIFDHKLRRVHIHFVVPCVCICVWEEWRGEAQTDGMNAIIFLLEV